MKIKKMLFAVLLICCSFLMVNAEESDVFKYDWTKRYEYEYSDQLYYHNKIYYENGYIITDFDEDESATKIVQYDSKGEVVKENVLKDILIVYLEVCDEDIYAIGYNKNSKLVAKISSDFEIEREYLDERNLFNPYDYSYYRDMHRHFFAVKDDEVLVYCNSGVLILDSNFKDASFKSSEDFTEKDYLEMSELFSVPYERFEELYDEDYYMSYFDIEGDVEAYILFDDNDKIYLRVYKDDKELYTKKLSSRIYYNNNIQSFRIVNNYVLIMTLDEILIYDLNGDKLQTIYIDDALEVADIKEDENYYYRFYNLVPGNNSFMYSICETSDIIDREQSRFECLNGPSGANLDTLEMTDSQLDMRLYQKNYVNIYDQVWYLPINVITKTDGNGQVEAIDTARYGDVVTFKVTPNKGYILESVKVTDSNGNVVVFTDYTFTVPSSDVTIEAIFTKEVENPDTADIVVCIISFILLITVIYNIIYIKKMDKLI